MRLFKLSPEGIARTMVNDKRFIQAVDARVAMTENDERIALMKIGPDEFNENAMFNLESFKIITKEASIYRFAREKAPSTERIYQMLNSYSLYYHDMKQAGALEVGMCSLTNSTEEFVKNEIEHLKLYVDQKREAPRKVLDEIYCDFLWAVFFDYQTWGHRLRNLQNKFVNGETNVVVNNADFDEIVRDAIENEYDYDDFVVDETGRIYVNAKVIESLNPNGND